MKWMRRASALAGLVLSTSQAWAGAGAPAETIGEIGGGFFLARGADRAVVGLSPVGQVGVGVGFLRHLGLDAQLLYTHFLLSDEAARPFAGSSGSQTTVLAGLRVSTGRVLENRRPAVGYLSLRMGWAREVVRVASPTLLTPGLPAGAWISGSWNTLKTPVLFPGVRSSDRRGGVVLSPKAAVLVRVSHRAGVELALQPLFVFRQRRVTTQAFMTLGIALSSWEVF